jgi:flagellar L-ring protein precursor FlgH
MMQINNYRLARLVTAVSTLVIVSAASAKKVPQEDFSVTQSRAPETHSANGSIFQLGSYMALTSGARAARVGDLVSIILVENTRASKSNAAAIDRSGSGSFSPPSTGPLNIFQSSDVNMSGQQSFKGKGDAAQSNALIGEISVTIAAAYPNGTFLVRGEKFVTLNRGDERLQISGIIRSVDLNSNNEVESNRVANAHIRYVGKGEIANASRQGWLQRFFTAISPF